MFNISVARAESWSSIGSLWHKRINWSGCQTMKIQWKTFTKGSHPRFERQDFEQTMEEQIGPSTNCRKSFVERENKRYRNVEVHCRNWKYYIDIMSIKARALEGLCLPIPVRTELGFCIKKDVLEQKLSCWDTKVGICLSEEEDCPWRSSADFSKVETIRLNFWREAFPPSSMCSQRQQRLHPI